MTRKPWDRYWLEIAEKVATRSTCPRLSVGCVIVRNNRIVSTGYNGSVPGEQHCDDVGCAVIDRHCSRSVHAEVNAVIQAAREGVALDDCVAYVTFRPCWPCAKVLMSLPHMQVIYGQNYGDTYPIYSLFADRIRRIE